MAIGGIPALTAVLVVITGIFGAVIAGGLLRLLRIRDEAAKGLAMGVSAHGIGTATAFQHDRERGAFAGLGMALSGAITALLLPVALRLLGVTG